MAVQAAISGPRFGWQAVSKDQFASAVTARLADMGAGCVPLLLGSASSSHAASICLSARVSADVT